MPEASPNGRIPIWKAFLSKTGCPDAACLRKAPTGVLHKANADTIRELDAGDLGPTSGFYPVVDGSYIPDTVPRLLDQGRFHKEVRSVISSSSRWEVTMPALRMTFNGAECLNAGGELCPAQPRAAWVRALSRLAVLLKPRDYQED